MAVVGRSEQSKLDRLIQEVARGQRTLQGIHDPALRESVRVALRMHEDAPSGPDEYTRRRIRARVMSGLRPQRPTMRDNAWAALWYLGRPAPYIVRSVALVAILVCFGLGATITSAESLPDDLLYPVKLASESVRLALAGAPEDRAAVELSIAEHRLVEAEKLAAGGRSSDALVASAVYSQHIASAALELAPQADQSVTVNAQLEQSFSAQRDRAQALATILALQVSSARGAQVLAMIAAPTLAPGRTQVERIAETAASLAVDLADAADEEVAEMTADDAASAQLANATPRPTGAPEDSAKAPVLANASPHVTTSATPHAGPLSRASDNAKATRRAAVKARAAAEKLKETLKELRGKQSQKDDDR
jgi:Domain of unknown function (DUF5667)